MRILNSPYQLFLVFKMHCNYVISRSYYTFFHFSYFYRILARIKTGNKSGRFFGKWFRNIFLWYGFQGWFFCGLKIKIIRRNNKLIQRTVPSVFQLKGKNSFGTSGHVIGFNGISTTTEVWRKEIRYLLYLKIVFRVFTNTWNHCHYFLWQQGTKTAINGDCQLFKLPVFLPSL